MNRERAANRISDIFNPYYSSAPFFWLVAASATPNAATFLLNAVILTAFFSVLPLWDIMRRIRRGLVRDAHINSREDRLKPFLFSLACAVAGLVALYVAGAPDEVLAVAWTVVALGATITVVTTVWKISLHAAGITSIAAMLYFIFGVAAAPVALLVPVVGWARLALRKHTPSQLAAGILVALVITAGVFSLFGLI
ncbi:MAG TPA: phosphatidic acid phosphatase [Actinobacteria bacterium]|nr:phosphatidic acid phosphatase [Actinomycetota bacterium]